MGWRDLVPKWEYCIVHGIDVYSNELHTANPVLISLTSGGAVVETDFRKRPPGVSEVNLVAMKIAELGEAGWELVGVGNGVSSIDRFYFKRPKP